jgi:hypothetical protein
MGTNKQFTLALHSLKDLNRSNSQMIHANEVMIISLVTQKVNTFKAARSMQGTVPRSTM